MARKKGCITDNNLTIIAHVGILKDRLTLRSVLAFLYVCHITHMIVHAVRYRDLEIYEIVPVVCASGSQIDTVCELLPSMVVNVYSTDPALQTSTKQDSAAKYSYTSMSDSCMPLHKQLRSLCTERSNRNSVPPETSPMHRHIMSDFLPSGAPGKYCICNLCFRCNALGHLESVRSACSIVFSGLERFCATTHTSGYLLKWTCRGCQCLTETAALARLLRMASTSQIELRRWSFWAPCWMIACSRSKATHLLVTSGMARS